uniref:Uncharacterized protein n=1 Tax=Anopheles atroparvus TaxID=41427 RepID=A0AAG5CP07_ANOAO
MHSSPSSRSPKCRTKDSHPSSPPSPALPGKEEIASLAFGLMPEDEQPLCGDRPEHRGVAFMIVTVIISSTLNYPCLSCRYRVGTPARLAFPIGGQVHVAAPPPAGVHQLGQPVPPA